MLKNFILGGMALVLSHSALAIGLFETNPSTLYPPGCISNELDGLTSPTFSREVYVSDIVPFESFPDGGTVNVNIEVWRRGCKEEDRSVLFVKFEMLSPNKQFVLPRLTAVRGPNEYPLRLVSEPNTFEHNQTGLLVGLGSYEFLVDGQSEASINNNTTLMLPSEYNGSFILKVTDSVNPDIEYDINLGAWNPDIVPFRIPLNGRHSGVWGAEGAMDQGFVISFNEFVSPDEDTMQQVFFSWYTFGPDGETLWLTAGNFFDRGDSTVELPLELVTGGEFMGDATADREVISTATLNVVNCNEMTLTYDLTDIGLDAGEATLRRLFSLETAGYACRDVEARLDAL